MKNWKTAVDMFLRGWKEKDKVIAAMACGSYVTGDPTKHSDIDLHLILTEDRTEQVQGNPRGLTTYLPMEQLNAVTGGASDGRYSMVSNHSRHYNRRISIHQSE
jgi:hypothetical protein